MATKVLAPPRPAHSTWNYLDYTSGYGYERGFALQNKNNASPFAPAAESADGLPWEMRPQRQGSFYGGQRVLYGPYSV